MGRRCGSMPAIDGGHVPRWPGGQGGGSLAISPPPVRHVKKLAERGLEPRRRGVEKMPSRKVAFLG